jgi:hypothetical protein
VTARRRRCACCGQLVGFVAYIQRPGFGEWAMRVCEPCLQRGDRIFYGRGPRDYTVHTFQTSPCRHPAPVRAE